MASDNLNLFSSGVGDLSSAVSSLFAGEATKFQAEAADEAAVAAKAAGQADVLKGEGDVLEGQMNGTAADLAKLNATYTAQSTAIQVAKADRAQFMQLGSEKAAAAGSGGTGGGSAADILRSSAEQGALNRGVLQQQGLITEAGYTEQATSYGYMQKAANVAAQAEDVAATGEQATAQADLDAAKAYQEAGQGDFISSLIKGVAGVASLALAIPTGRASLAIPAALEAGGIAGGSAGGISAG
jgi:hypothetical protein